MVLPKTVANSTDGELKQTNLGLIFLQRVHHFNE
jgi:hypothetical protein